MSGGIPGYVSHAAIAFSNTIHAHLKPKFKDPQGDPGDEYGLLNRGLYIVDEKELKVNRRLEILELELRDTKSSYPSYQVSDSIGVVFELSGFRRSLKALESETTQPRYVKASFYHDPPKGAINPQCRARSNLIGSLKMSDLGETTITPMGEEKITLVSKVLGITLLTDHLIRFNGTFPFRTRTLDPPFKPDNWLFSDPEVETYLHTILEDLMPEIRERTGRELHIREMPRAKRLEGRIVNGDFTYVRTDKLTPK